VKPVMAPDGRVVKVEKDWWKMDKEKRERRIARKAEKEAKEREIAEANAKLLRVTEESQKQLHLLSSQVEMLMKAMSSQTGQPIASFLVPALPSTFQDTPQSANAPVLGKVTEAEPIQPISPYPRHEDIDVCPSISKACGTSVTVASPLTERMVEPEVMPACKTTLQDCAALESPVSEEEEKVDYEVSPRDLQKNKLVEDQNEVNIS
jgi:hypothetical protein